MIGIVVHQMVARLCILVVGMSLFGCAGVDVTPISENPGDEKVEGIRYYEPAPFILVHSDGKGGLVSKLLYLPDTTQKMAIDPYAYFSTNKTTLTFAKGMLIQSKSVIDETVVPKAAIEAALTSATAAVKAATFDAPKPDATDTSAKVPGPALYRLVVDPGGEIRLVGGYGLDPDGKVRQDIWVTVSQPAKPEASN